MKRIIVAPVGEYVNDLYIGIREFPADKIVLLTPENKAKIAEEVKKDLEKFRIKADIKRIAGNLWEEMFKAVASVKELYKDYDVIVHTSTGDRNTTCAATSAAFVNGLKAIAVDNDEVMLLPVLKFSYYKLLTDKKLEILKFLYNNDCCSSLDELSKKTRMSLPLVSYHINGNLKSEGLKELGLVITEEVKGRVTVKLTMLGKLLVKGHIS